MTWDIRTLKRGNSDMDMTTETRSAAANFLAVHDQLTNDLSTARLTIDDQRKEIERLDAKLSLQSEMLVQSNADKNEYLQYSFELSAQLQFIVGGSARALLIAGQVRNAIAAKAANIPPVDGASVKELEDILHRIGDNNANANDGAGLTNAAPPAMPGAGPQDLPAGLVDRDGNPVNPSAATKVLAGL